MCIAYIYEDYFIFQNKLTLLMMTTVIWCCVFNLSWAYTCQAGVHWNVCYWWRFLFNVYKRFFILATSYVFNAVYFLDVFTSMVVTGQCGQRSMVSDKRWRWRRARVRVAMERRRRHPWRVDRVDLSDITTLRQRTRSTRRGLLDTIDVITACPDLTNFNPLSGRYSVR